MARRGSLLPSPWSLALLLGFGVGLLLPTVAAERDACMTRLADALIPACAANVCSPACCDALHVPDRSGCSAAWEEEYHLHARRTLARRRAQCSASAPKCDVRAPCMWSTQTSDSPCLQSDCSALFERGEMTPKCFALADAFCALQAKNDVGCAWLQRGFAQCGVSSAQWTACADRGNATTSIVEAAVKNVTDVPVRRRTTTLSKEATEWISYVGCTTLPTTPGQRRPCNAVSAMRSSTSETRVGPATLSTFVVEPLRVTREIIVVIVLGPLLSALVYVHDRFARLQRDA